MESKDNELKKQIDRDNKTISMILYTVTFIIISIMSSRNQLDIGGFLRAEIVGIVVLTIILFYVRIENKIDSVNNYYVLSVGYLIALLIMVVSSYLKTYNLLIVGTMFIAMAIDLNCAIIVNVFLIIIGNLLLNYNTEYTVHILIFTLISSIIAKYLKKKKFLFTVIQILLTFNITIMIILNYFKITKGFILEMVFSSISVLAAIIAVYYLYKAYLTHINKNNISKTTEELNKKLDSLISNINKPEAELAYAVDNNIQNNEIDKEKIIIEEKTFIEVAVNTNINESIEITSKNEISTNEISIQEVEIETEVDAVINADLENNADTEIVIETTEEIMEETAIDIINETTIESKSEEEIDKTISMSESDVLSETIPESQELSDDNINDLNNDEIKDNNTLLEDFLYDAELDTDEEVDVKEASIEAIRSEINKKQRESKLDLILDENYKLLTLMKESNITLYEHSLYLSKLSCEIAELIGGNVPIVKAGALYHEVGKLYSKEYIQESVNTAIINEFPREVTDIIRQYSLTIEVPKSVEAAIIMLTDSAISTIEYVKSRTDKKAAPMNRIIDSVLNARISQNALDESGLNMEQLKTIRGFLIEEFTKVE